MSENEIIEDLKNLDIIALEGIKKMEEKIELYNKLFEKQQEIERLNNIIEEIIKICEENEYLTLIKDIKRLKDSDKVE